MAFPLKIIVLILAHSLALQGKILELSLNVESKPGKGKLLHNAPTSRLGNKRHHRFYISSESHSMLSTEVGYDYKLNISFGSNKQRFEISIDTGSADLWIPSVECTECFSTVRFDCANSRTCREFPDDFLTLHYLDGPVSGHIAFDDVELGPNMAIKNVSFMLVSKTVGDIYYNTGIMGLGLQALSANPNPTLISRMFDSKLISNYAFSIFLTLDDKQSKIVFGGWDRRLARAGETPVYAKIISAHSYTVSFESLTVGFAEPIPLHSALIDSGNSMITLSKYVMDTIIEHINLQSNIKCYYQPLSYSPNWLEIYCSAFQGVSADFPNITMSLGPKNHFLLRPNDYLENCSYFAANRSTLCLTKFETSEFMGMNILGAAFMQAYYTIFDLTKMHIGFVHSAYENKVRFKFYDAFGAETVAQPIPNGIQSQKSVNQGPASHISAKPINKAFISSTSKQVANEQPKEVSINQKSSPPESPLEHKKVDYSGVQLYSIMGAGMCLPIVLLGLNYLDKKGRISEEKKYGIVGLVFLGVTVVVAIALSLSARV